MKIVVLYSSRYGTTKRYAEWIAEELDAEVYQAAVFSPGLLLSYDLVIFGGSLIGSSISGVRLVAENPVDKLIVFTVGLFYPPETDYSPAYETSFSAAKQAMTKFFHFRGGLDVSQLRRSHKMMLSMAKRSIERKDPSERTESERALLEAFEHPVDFTDRESIAPLVEYVRSISS